MSFESPARKTERPEPSPEREPIRKEYEYRDSEGRLLGRAVIELDPEEHLVRYRTREKRTQGMARTLRSFMLEGEKDGRPTSIDVLKLANPHGIEVLVADERLENYGHFDADKLAVVPPLETALDVGTALHELGHAGQYRDERFEKITPLYNVAKMLSARGAGPYLRLKRPLQFILEAVPEAKEIVDAEEIGQLDRLEKRRGELKAEIKAADKKRRSAEAHLAGLLQRAAGRAINRLVPENEMGGLVADMVNSIEQRPDDEAHARRKREAVVRALEKAGFRFRSEDEPENGDLAKAIPREKLLDGTAHLEHLALSPVFYLLGGEFRVVRLEGRKLRVTMSMPKAVTDSEESAEAVLELELSEEDDGEFEKQRQKTETVLRETNKLGLESGREILRLEEAQEELMRAMRIEDILNLPTKLMERDATRRAFQWLREVRQKAGTDLLKRMKVPLEATLIGEACESSVVEGAQALAKGREDRIVETGIVEDLRNALATYRADKFRMKKPGQEGDIGIMPKAGGKRKKA